MGKYNKKKADQLGMPIGTASNRLRKIILFDFVRRLELDTCFQCGKVIDDIDNFSIEHPIPWLDSKDPVGLFFSTDNIAFSHLKCNIGAARKINRGERTDHGTYTRYTKHGCRCDFCKQANANYRYQLRHKQGRTTARSNYAPVAE